MIHSSAIVALFFCIKLKAGLKKKKRRQILKDWRLVRAKNKVSRVWRERKQEDKPSNEKLWLKESKSQRRMLQYKIIFFH